MVLCLIENLCESFSEWCWKEWCWSLSSPWWGTLFLSGDQGQKWLLLMITDNRECLTTVHFVPQQVYLGYGRLFILSSTNIKWQRNLSEIFGCGYNEREINLKYLDADKMRGKVQNSECRTSHWNFAIVHWRLLKPIDVHCAECLHIFFLSRVGRVIWIIHKISKWIDMRETLFLCDVLLIECQNVIYELEKGRGGAWSNFRSSENVIFLRTFLPSKFQRPGKLIRKNNGGLNNFEKGHNDI